jgi:hypothetical protein
VAKAALLGLKPHLAGLLVALDTLALFQGQSETLDPDFPRLMKSSCRAWAHPSQ